MADVDNLTLKQQRFVEEYLVDLNAKQAAMRAGYSVKTAEVQGARLLSNAKVHAAVAAGRAAQTERTLITADVVLGELLRLARVDIGQAFNANGTLKAIHDMPEDVRRAISAVEVKEDVIGSGDDAVFTGYTRKVRFWDKKGALELLGKHLKLFTDQVEHSGTLRLEDLLARSRG